MSIPQHSGQNVIEPVFADTSLPVTYGSRRQWVIFLMLLLCHCYFLQIYPRWMSPNELSRFLLTSAIVDDGTLSIDRAIQRYGDTQDKAVWRGHYYSEKAIGVSLLAVLPYLFLKWLAAPFHYQWPVQLVLFWVRLFCVTIPALFLLRPLERFWRRISPNGKLVPYFLFLFLFGTIAFPYSLQLISHHLVGMFLFLSFYNIHISRETNSLKSLLLGGTSAAVALTLEYPAVLPVIAIMGYSFWILPEKRKWIWCALPLVPAVFLVMGYHYEAFGNPFDVGVRHMADPELVQHHVRGVAGVGWAGAQALQDLLLSRHHGLFFWSPFLLFSLPGFYFFLTNPKFFRESILFLVVSLCYIFAYSGFTDWMGGWSLGPRYLTAVVPFLMTAALVFFSQESVRKSSLFSHIGLFLGFLSLLFITVGTITFPFPPQEMKDPYFHLHIPLFFHGAFAINLGSWLPIPSFGTSILFYSILFMTFLTMITQTPLVVTAKPVIRALVTGSLAVVCIAAGYFLAGPPSAFDRFAKGRIYYFLGQYEYAYDELIQARSQNPDAQLSRMIDSYLSKLYE